MANKRIDELPTDNTPDGDEYLLIQDPSTLQYAKTAISNVGGGGGGAVTSVNGQTGTVVLDSDDITEGTTNRYMTSAEKTKLSGIQAGAQVNTVTSVAGKTGAVTLVKGDVGLGNVDNTSDLAKPISSATQTALNGKANTVHTHTASQVTDFDVEVSNNTDVAANTTARHTHANKAILDATQEAFTTALKSEYDGKEDAFTKGNLVAGANVSLSGTLTNRLVGSGNVTINATGGGGGGGQVDSVVAGDGIDVDNTDPINPEVGLDSATQASLALADTATQPGDLGTAAAADTTDFATAAQGATADTAVQPADLATVATTGDYDDLTGKPAIPAQFNPTAGTNMSITGTYPNMTFNSTGGGGGGAVDSVVAGDGIDVDSTDPINPEVSLDGASQASLALANTAMQPGDLSTVAETGSYDDLADKPDIPPLNPAGTTDAIQEWWVYPLATYLKESDRTVYGSISSTGKVLACEVDHVTGQEQRVEAGTALVDDHNCPALWAESGRRLLLAWTNHNNDNVVHFKVSDAGGTVASLAVATDQSYTLTGGLASYTQIHKIASLSNATNDVFWVFTRSATLNWSILQVSVNQTTGALSVDFERQVFAFAGQAYISTAPSNDSTNKIRVALGFNPSGTDTRVFYCEIATSDGAITSPTLGTIGNVSGTNLPLDESDIFVAVPAVATNFSRRLFYVRPGPSTPAIAHAVWANATPDEATYYTATATTNAATSWVSNSYGLAGTRVGYIASSNYIAGMAFENPSYDNNVLIARQLDGRSTIELHTVSARAASKVIVASTTSRRFIRPVAPVNGGRLRLMFSDVSSYSPTTYSNYAADVRFANGNYADVSVASEVKLQQSGWSSIEGNGTASIARLLYFPTTFSSPPAVVVSSIGAATATGTPGTSPADFGTNIPATVAVAVNDTAANVCRVQIDRSSGTFTANRWYGFAWIATEL